MFRPTSLVLAASLGLVGCNLADKQEAQTDDSNNPHYKQAQVDIDNNNPTAAVADYDAALAQNPKLAGAHYKMGLIYGEKLNDPVGAIFHFRQYLELEPNSDKAAEVKSLIEKESQAFATSLPNSPAQSSDDYARLQSENTTLKKQVNDATRTISQLQSQLGRHHSRVALMTPRTDDVVASSGPTPVIPVSTDSAPVIPATNAAPMRATAVDTNSPDVNSPAPVMSTNGTPAAPAGPSKNYTVVKGDRIDRIAKKMYGTGKVIEGRDKILAANPGLDPKKLKIGQILVIPQ